MTIYESILASSTFCYFHLHVQRMATIYLSYGIEHACHTIHLHVLVMIFLKANIFKIEVYICKVMQDQDKLVDEPRYFRHNIQLLAWQEDDTWLVPLPQWQEEGMKGYLPITQKDFPVLPLGVLCTFLTAQWLLCRLHFGSKIWRAGQMVIIPSQHNGAVLKKKSWNRLEADLFFPFCYLSPSTNEEIILGSFFEILYL